MSTLDAMLRSHYACEEAVEWASAYSDPRLAWEALHRADWAAWVAVRARPDLAVQIAVQS